MSSGGSHYKATAHIGVDSRESVVHFGGSLASPHFFDKFANEQSSEVW